MNEDDEVEYRREVTGDTRLVSSCQTSLTSSFGQVKFLL